jgi:hypothetical protein
MTIRQMCLGANRAEPWLDDDLKDAEPMATVG